MKILDFLLMAVVAMNSVHTYASQPTQYNRSAYNICLIAVTAATITSIITTKCVVDSIRDAAYVQVYQQGRSDCYRYKITPYNEEPWEKKCLQKHVAFYDLHKQWLHTEDHNNNATVFNNLLPEYKAQYEKKMRKKQQNNNKSSGNKNTNKFKKQYKGR